MAYVQPSLFNPAGFTMMNINCRQAAQNQDIQMVGSVNHVADGANAWPQSKQQNGPQISDLHGATAFTNGRKRSRENIECEEMKKAKTTDCNHEADAKKPEITIKRKAQDVLGAKPTTKSSQEDKYLYRQLNWNTHGEGYHCSYF